MNQALRIRSLDPKDGPFEEIGTTKNVSQGGVYFVTQQASYREGMRLSVMYLTRPLVHRIMSITEKSLG